MGALAWVETLDRRGHVRARARIDALPALIGRGYGCDVLLDDPWASPIHVRVYRDLDGSLKVEDAGSENGLWSAVTGARVTLLAVGQGVALRAGRTDFRIVPADATVPAALPMHAAAPADGGWDRWQVGLGAAAACGAFYALFERLGDPATHPLGEMVTDALAMLIVLALWAGIWALVTRAVWQRARFTAHLAVAALGVLAFELLWQGIEFATFLFPGSEALAGFLAVVGLAGAATMLTGHLALATALGRRRAFLVSSAIVLGFTGLGALVASQDEDVHEAMPQFSSELKPLRAGLIPTEDTTAFFAGLAELRTSVDSLASAPDE